MDAIEQLNQTIEEARSTLSPSQLKKLRKKRGKLLHKVVHAQLNADQSAAKRLCLDPSAEQDPSTSLQLSGHGPSTVAAGKDQEAMSQPLEASAAAAAAAAGAAHQHKQQAQRHQHGRPPLPQQAGNGIQQQLAQHRQDLGNVQHAGHAGSRHGKHTAVPTSSTSTGPCRTDLSGQLVVIQQELNSNTTGDHSNSTYSQLLLQHQAVQQPAAAAAAAGSDCSHGTHPAHASGAVAQGHQQDSNMQVQQQNSQQQQQQQSRKRSRPSCQYGNYHHYYGYRLKPSGFEDPRLKVLDPSWFQGADVLDVGCNEGLVTLALAVHCGCRSVCGVDIDPVLVSKACTNLSRCRSQLNQQLHEAVRERNAQSMMPRQYMQLEPVQKPQQEPQQQEAGPLGIIAASAMQPPASKRSRISSTAAEAAAADAVGHGGKGAHSKQDKQADSSAVPAPASAAAEAGDVAPPEQQPAKHHHKQHLRQPPHAHGAHHHHHHHHHHQQQQQQQQQQTPKARIVSAQRQIKGLSRVSFRAGNWLDVPCPSNKYEVITCFSVTKWIQLNWGDDGVMKLFNKFYRCLAPEGLLVLEPQPFKSYKSALHKPGVQAAPYVNLDQLKLRPEQYAEYLTQRVGFELVKQLDAVSEAAGADAVSVKGFDRPIIVLRKPAAAGVAAAGTQEAQ